MAVSSELNEWAQWPGLAQVGRLSCVRRRKGQLTQETSCLITSRSPEQASPAQVLRLVRGHWGIENRLHCPPEADSTRIAARCEPALLPR